MFLCVCGFFVFDKCTLFDSVAVFVSMIHLIKIKYNIIGSQTLIITAYYSLFLFYLVEKFFTLVVRKTIFKAT